MKKSRSITLTVLAAMSMSGALAQSPTPPVKPKDCDKTPAAAGPSAPSNCPATAVHGSGAHGGFGATAKGHHGGG